MFPRLLAGDGTGLGMVLLEILVERGLGSALLIGSILLALGGENDIFQLVLGGQGYRLLIGCIHDDHLILVGDEFADSTVHL